MAVSKVIRGGVGEAEVCRWELPDVSLPDDEFAESEEPKDPEAEAAARQLAEELEAIKRGAYDEAFAQGKKEGYESGFEQGKREGSAAGEKSANKKAKQIGKILDSLGAPLEELDEQVEEQLLSLTLVLSEQIIRRELHIQPGEIMAVVRESLGLLPLSSRDVKVTVHPEDAAFLREAIGDDDEDQRWKLIEDASVTRGGCYVSSHSSKIDATLERRLALLASDLLGGERAEDAHESGQQADD